MTVEKLQELLVRFENEDTRQRREASQHIYAMLASAPGDHVARASAYSQNGLRRFALGDLDGSMSDFQESIRICANPTAYYNRGLVAMQMSNWERAIADFGAAIQLTPDNAYLYFNRAMSIVGCLHENGSDGTDDQLHEITDFIISDFGEASRLGHPDAYEYLRDIRNA